MNLPDNIQPYWTEEEHPEFIKDTGTSYCKVPIKSLVERNLHNRLLENFIQHLPDGCFVAGGFLTSFLLGETQSKDIDVFCTSAQAFKSFCELLLSVPPKQESEEDNYWSIRDYKLASDLKKFEKNSKEFRYLLFNHEKATRPKIQVMKMYWYESPQRCIDTFDFTICQIAMDKEWVYLHPLTQFDLSSKKLVLHRMQFPASSIRRLIKYSKKGFYACSGSLVNIAESIRTHIGQQDINEENFVYVD